MSERQSVLQDVLRFAERCLNDCRQEIPEQIISGGYAIQEDGSHVDLGRPMVYKCQRGWFMGPIGIAGRIKKRFPPQSDAWQKADAYEKFITARKNIPIELDPYSAIDANGQMHRLTTKEEIDQSDNFLRYIIELLRKEIS